MNKSILLFLIAAACCGTLIAQTGPGGPGAGTGANPLALTPASGPLPKAWYDANIQGPFPWNRYNYLPGIQATDIHQQNTGGYLNWEIVDGALPPGITFVYDFDAATQGWAPGQGTCGIDGVAREPGSYTFTLRCTDQFSRVRAYGTYSIVVVDYYATLPVIITGSLPDAATGTNFTQLIDTHAGVAPYAWSWAAEPGSSLPPGLTLDTSGTLSWTMLTGTPTADGLYCFRIKVVDGNGDITEQAYRLKVGDPAPEMLGPNGSVNVAAGQPYFVPFEARNCRPHYTWTARNLPDGWSMNARTGLLSALSPAVGTYDIEIRMFETGSPLNNNPPTLARTVQFVVTNPGSGGAPLSITTPAMLPSGNAGLDYQFTLAATGGTPGYNWTSTNLPTGLGLSTAGVVSALAGDLPSGSYSFDVTVSDAASGSDSKLLSLNMAPGAPAGGGPTSSASGGGGGGGCAVGGGVLLPLLLPILLLRRRRD